LLKEGTAARDLRIDNEETKAETSREISPETTDKTSNGLYNRHIRNFSEERDFRKDYDDLVGLNDFDILFIFPLLIIFMFISDIVFVREQ
jgi:hypothetical protein